MMTGEEFRTICRGFYCSGRISTDDDVKFIHIYNKLTKVINLALNLRDYSLQLEDIGVIFVCINPKYGIPEKGQVCYWKKYQKLEVFVNVDREVLESLTEEQDILALLAEVYLKAVKKYLWKRRIFDAKRFYADLEKVFEPLRQARFEAVSIDDPFIPPPKPLEGDPRDIFNVLSDKELAKRLKMSMPKFLELKKQILAMP